VKEMTVQHERSKNKELKVTRGWYSEADMKDDLKWKAQHGPIIFINQSFPTCSFYPQVLVV
jgi:hypothetical protein